jgi:acetylcholinesterase
MSVDYYNFACPEYPIVSSLIMDSGTALFDATTSSTEDTTHANFTFVAGQLGCGNLTQKDELDCMRTVNPTDIEAFLGTYQDGGTQPSISFSPVVDNRTRFANYTARTLAKNFTRLVCLPSIDL